MQLDVGNEPYLLQQRLTEFFLECTGQKVKQMQGLQSPGVALEVIYNEWLDCDKKLHVDLRLT